MVKSFRESRYAYTRVTCVSAALTILREYERIKDSNVAAIWVVPAFTIGASIIIMLDLLHTPFLNTAISGRREMIQEVVESLENDRHNVMAMRGVKLLRALLSKERDMREAQSAPGQTSNSNFGQEDLFGPPLPGPNRQVEHGSVMDYVGFEAWFEESVPYFSSNDLDLPSFETWG